MTENKEHWKVLISDFNYKDNTIETQTLANYDASVIVAQCTTEEEIIEAGKTADGIISQYAPITGKVIESLPRCKALARFGIGVDTIDVAKATEHKIPVINVPSYCENEVSDHALALLLAWARRIPHYNNKTHDGRWDWKTGTPIHRLQNQLLGLVGFGKIAQALAAKARNLGLDVIAHDPFVSKATFRKEGVRRVDWQFVLSQSDYLSIHVPLTPKTRYLINSEALSQMKPSACLVNTSRGPVVEENALVQALEKGKLAGACLDVLEDEIPSEDNPLFRFPQVLLTPHVAWYSEESQSDLRRKVSEDVGRALNGQLPHGLVNTELTGQFEPDPN